MTNEEMKKKISDAPEQKWFQEVSVTFRYPIFPEDTRKGVLSIYDFVNQQIDGWNEHGELPEKLKESKSRFENTKNKIVEFVNKYSQENEQSLRSIWIKEVGPSIGPSFTYETNGRPGRPGQPAQLKSIRTESLFPYDKTEIVFLMDVYRKTPRYFEGAYNFITKTNMDIKTHDILYGAMLATEFTLADYSEITKKRTIEKRSIEQLKTEFKKYISDSENRLSGLLDDADISCNKRIKEFDDLKTEKEENFSDWLGSAKGEISKLEETYREKLKLEEPAKYWTDRARELKIQGWWYLVALVASIVVICCFLGGILWNPPEMFKESIFSEDKSIAIKWILIYVTLLSFSAYIVRALSKLMFSSFHLRRDCEERHALTYFYLSLLKDSKVDEKDRQLIMQSLFSRSDTGLLKDDSLPAMPNDSVNKFISR